MIRPSKSLIRLFIALAFALGCASNLHAQTLELSHTMSAAKSGVVAVAFSSSSQEFLTGDADGSLQIWDAEQGKLVKSFQTNISNFRSVAWSPDNTVFVGAGCENQEYSQDQIQVWARGKGTWLSTLSTNKKPEQSTYINSVAFSPNGQILAAGMSIQDGNQEADPSRGAIVLWNTNTGKPIKVLPEAGDVTQIAFSPDGKTLVCASNVVVGYKPDDRVIFRGVVSLWAVSSGKRIRSMGFSDTFVGSLSFSPDGRKVALGCELLSGNSETSVSKVKIWDSQTGKVVGMLDGLSSAIYDITFSPDGLWIVTTSDTFKFGESAGSEIKVWNTKTGKPSLEQQVGESVRALSFSPDGSQLVTGGFPVLKTQVGGKLESFDLAQFKGVVKVWSFDAE